MSSGKDASASTRAIGSVARTVLSARNVAMLTAGILAGYSIAVLGKDAVLVPLVGSVPGSLVGVVGLAVAAAAYRRGSCCGNGDTGECGCTGECGDSCSHDP